ncbi:hypothetical protein IWX90DRAFT_504486 [Phyllosticta citrichinensis]|uniref:Cell wall hydroxyproline-rich glycoprotein n=1 Tax=Phyllosticta citrichinensis TaxID=1130410 RepID=A0ABR1XQ70_9PEZI
MMGFLSLLSSTLFLSLALGAPQAQVPNYAQTDSKSKPPTTGPGTGPGTGTGTGTGVNLANNLERDKRTIQAFVKTVTGDRQGVLKSWKGGDPCNFKGFKCDNTPKGYKAVAALDFNGYRLGGPGMVLHDLLDKLVDLAIFHANSNKFIPWLYELDLSNNQLSGKFPMGVLTAKKLTFLDLRFNQFEGPVPSEVFHMDLDVLFLNNNKFTGSIASDIGASPALYITLANNQFDGYMPRELNNMKGLREIIFLGNKFSGTLPIELGGMAALNVFDVSDNQLSGKLPKSLCGLPNLEILALKNNQFDGSLPNKLNYLKGLQEIHLDGNKFCGSLPTELGGMAALTVFDASDDQLSGTVPESLCGLPKLKTLVLKNNQFAEDLGPKCLDALNKKKLDVAGNCIKNAPNQKPGCGTGKDDSKSTGSTNTDRTRSSLTDGNAPQRKPS